MSPLGESRRSVVQDGDEEGRRIAREVAGRAIRRLGWLEAAMMAATALLALLAGAVVAFLLASAGLPFRGTWAVASLLLFIVPAVATWMRDRRSS